MTVIHGNFGRPENTSLVDHVVATTREGIAQKLSETGFHTGTSQKVCDLLGDCVSERLESVLKELSFSVTTNVTYPSAAPDDVAAAVSHAWQVEIHARLEAIGRAAFVAMRAR